MQQNGTRRYDRHVLPFDMLLVLQNNVQQSSTEYSCLLLMGWNMQDGRRHGSLCSSIQGFISGNSGRAAGATSSSSLTHASFGGLPGSIFLLCRHRLKWIKLHMRIHHSNTLILMFCFAAGHLFFPPRGTPDQGSDFKVVAETYSNPCLH